MDAGNFFLQDAHDLLKLFRVMIGKYTHTITIAICIPTAIPDAGKFFLSVVMPVPQDTAA